MHVCTLKRGIMIIVVDYRTYQLRLYGWVRVEKEKKKKNKQKTAMYFLWLDVRKGIAQERERERRNQWIKHPSLIYSRFTTLLGDTIVLCYDCNERKLVYAIENEEKDRSLLTSNINIYIHIYIRYVTHFIDRQLSWPFLSLSNFLQQNEIDIIK